MLSAEHDPVYVASDNKDYVIIYADCDRRTEFRSGKQLHNLANKAVTPNCRSRYARLLYGVKRSLKRLEDMRRIEVRRLLELDLNSEVAFI